MKANARPAFLNGVPDNLPDHSFMGKFAATPLDIPDVVLVKAQKFGDHRGYFMESFSREAFAAFGIRSDFIQDNQSMSERRGTLRGLHYQTPPHAQAKLVRVLKGAIFDVAVDIRSGSPTYGRWCGATLTADGGEQLFVPQGFAHAFCTLETNTEVAYKVDNYYAPECDRGIIWNDADIAIDWPISPQEAVLSDKDVKLPRLADIVSPFKI
jgi:dTDP-4-dehydrorhamnose 3,5-epimerase